MKVTITFEKSELDSMIKLGTSIPDVEADTSFKTMEQTCNGMSMKCTLDDEKNGIIEMELAPKIFNKICDWYSGIISSTIDFVKGCISMGKAIFSGHMKSLQNIAEEMDIDNMTTIVDGKALSKDTEDNEEDEKTTESALKDFEAKVNANLSEE